MTEQVIRTPEAEARELLRTVSSQRRRAWWIVHDGFVEFAALQVAFMLAKLVTGDHRISEYADVGLSVAWMGAFALWGSVAYVRRSKLGVGLHPRFVPAWTASFLTMVVAGQLLHGDARFGVTAGIIFVTTAWLAVVMRSLILASVGLWLPLLAMVRAAGWADWLVLVAIVPWAVVLYVTRGSFKR